MSSVRGGNPPDISTAAAADSPASLVIIPYPPPPPRRKFSHENYTRRKGSSETLRSIVLFGMETAQDSPPHDGLVSSMSPPDSQPYTCPPDLPPEFCPSPSSPPPPPPPPSYLFPELSSEDLPSPPPPSQMFLDVSLPPPPLYIQSYDPPSPEIKSEYDPPLPRGFSSQSEHPKSNWSLPPPPRPSPPPPPTPPVRQASRENLAVLPHSPVVEKSSVRESSEYKTPEDSKTPQSSNETADDFHKHIMERPPSSIISSSTLTATFLQTPESGMSPLPPHALRISPVSTDAITPSSQITDTDFTLTPTFSDLTSTPNFYDNKDSTLDMDTPEVTPQLSETPGTSPDSPTAVSISPVPRKFDPDKTLLLPPYFSSPTTSEISDAAHSTMSKLSPSKFDSESESEKNSSAFSESSDFGTLVGPNTTTTSTAGQAQILSPVSTELPSLFSLPTDSDTISADFDSFAADTLSPSAEFDPFAADVETSSVDTLVTGGTVDVQMTSSSPGFSDTAYATADSALGSATMSPAFTDSCTITPLPTDYFTPISTNATTTPNPSPITTEALSPIPSSPLPYFDAYHPAEHTLSITSSQDHLLHCEATGIERLVRCQASETSVGESSTHSLQAMSSYPLTGSVAPKHKPLCKSQFPINAQDSEADKYPALDNKLEMRNVKQELHREVQDYEENGGIKEAEEEPSRHQTMESTQSDAENERFHESESEIKNKSLIVTTSFTTNDKETLEMSRICEVQFSGVRMSDAIQQNMKSEAAEHFAEDMSQDSTKVDQDVHQAPLPPSAQPEINKGKRYDEFHEEVHEIYEIMEDVNGNINYVLEDKQKDQEITRETMNLLAKDTKDKNQELLQDISGEKENITSKESAEVLSVTKDTNERTECRSEERDNELQNKNGFTSTKVKIPKASSLPVLASPSGTPTKSLAPGEWVQSSLPSSPTPRTANSCNFYAFPWASSPLNLKSMPFSSPTVPQENVRAGVTMPSRRLSPSITPHSLVNVGVVTPRRRQKTVSLSASPEESLQLLDAVVVDLENISAGIPSSCPKQMISNTAAHSKLNDEERVPRTASMSLQEEKTSCLNSNTRSTSISKNLTQEAAYNLHTEAGTISESCTQHQASSSSSETEADAAIVRHATTIGTSNITPHDSCDGDHIQDAREHQMCVSSVNICLVAAQPQNKHDTPQPPLVTQSQDDIHPVEVLDTYSELCTQPHVTSSVVNSISFSSALNVCNLNMSSACSDVNVSSLSSENVDNLAASTNTDSKGELHEENPLSEHFTKDGTVQNAEVDIPSFHDKNMLVKNSTGNNCVVLDTGNHVNEPFSHIQSSLLRGHSENTPDSHLDSENSTLGTHSIIDDTKPKITSDSLPSQSSSCSSFGSMVEGVSSPWPASCAKSAPQPPPRSCINTPRQAAGAPLPPPRQYMLVPINHHHHGTQRRFSPPPAPPRSTSIRKSPPPPPPPRSVIHTPSETSEWVDFPPLPPPPSSCIITPTTPPPKLTPVPEESSSPTTPPSTRPSPRNSQTGSTPKMGEERTTGSLSCNTPSQTVSTVTVNTSLKQNDRNKDDPPDVPPPPIEDYEDLPPILPPPPLEESEVESVLPLPPLPNVFVCQPPRPPPPPRVMPPPPPLPPPPNVCFFSPDPSVRPLVSSDRDALSSSPCSIPPPSSESETTTSMFPPTSTAPPTSDVPEAPPLPMPGLNLSAASPSMPVLPHSLTSETKALASSAPPKSPISFASLPPRAHSPTCGIPGAPKSPLITTSPYGKIVIIRSDLPLPSPEEEIRLTFANVKDWGILDEDVETLSLYTQLRPVIQQGPQCGIVALSMASQVFPETVEVVELLEAAKKLGYSCHGEMFSCDAMAKLAGGINGMEATVRRDVLCNPRNILELLMQGDLILVPYDAERNHMPGLRNGYKAHWGVVCGCLVQCQSLNMYMGGSSKIDNNVDHLWHLRPRSRVGLLPKSRDGSITPITPVVPASPKLGCRTLRTPEIQSTFQESDSLKHTVKSHKECSLTRSSEADNRSISGSRVTTPMLPEVLQDEVKLIVLWRQGKSRKLVAAPLEQLCESNDQLISYPAATTDHEREYVIGSVQDGLAGQVVVLHKTKTALSDLVGILQQEKLC
nr:uncharacterized protein LOC123754096 [Procambarus clarkii]